VTLRPVALRLRLAATLVGAALLCGAPLAVALLLQQRDAAVQEASAGSLQAVSAVVGVIRGSCGQDAECAARVAQAAGLEWSPAACGESGACEDVAGGSLRSRADVRGAAVLARSRISATLVAVGIALAALVALLALAFDRLFVRPLVRLDRAFDRLSVESEVPLPEAGDLLGRLLPSVHRLEERLGEERSRVRAQLDELSQSNQKLREAREEAARSERLASVGRLAAGVAHELGNPVAAVLAYSSLLRAKPGTPETAEYAARMEREALRMDRILHDLLDLARPRDLELASIDVARTVEGAWAHAGAEGSLELRNALAGDFPRALADEHYLVQVFVNLFTNARKAGARSVDVRGKVEGDHIVVEVQDDGAGIPADVFPHLFEPFFTTAAPGKGTGLGLALCHASLERMGGSIEARPSPKGACFVLRMRKAAAG
jgi:two-component system, NtrC family, sensor kinase